jgi:hypothetical protein
MDGRPADWDSYDPVSFAVVGALLLLPVVLLLKWRRHGNDPISQARADWYGGMFKALLWVIVGAVLSGATYSSASTNGGGTFVVFWGLMLFGGLAFLWRAGNYFFRAKPQLDLLERMPAVGNPYDAPEPVPNSSRRGFLYWLGVAALGYLVVTVLARVAYNTRDTSQYRVPTAEPSLPGPSATTQPFWPTQVADVTVAAPTRTRESGSLLAWGDAIDFDDQMIAATTDGNNVTTSVRDGRYSVTLPPQGGYWSQSLGEATRGRDALLEVRVASASGQGAIALYADAEDGSYRWVYLVDPISRTWRVDRYSPERAAYFNWVEPRPLEALSFGRLHTVELLVEASHPTLRVNGQDVALNAGVELDQLPGSMRFAYGIYGFGFTAEFDAVEVSEV